MAPMLSFLTKAVGLTAIIGGVNAATNLRIMPVGASITFGVGSSTGNGYRQTLYEWLANDDYTVDFVGTQRNGNMADPDNEGYPTLRIDQVNEIVKTTAYQLNANVYTINLGTNDAGQDFNVDTAGARMEALCNTLWDATPDATIVLTTLILNFDAGIDQRAQIINAQFIDFATRLRNSGRRIVVMDLHGDNGPHRDQMAPDGYHPNDDGFWRMGTAIYWAINNARDSGFFG